jgi:superfamily I DNA and/or RNA helicase
MSLKTFNHTHYRRASKLLLLDNPHGNSFSVGATQSLVNLVNVAVAINLVVRLIKAGTAQPHDIVILTPYHAQHNRYVSALYRFQEDRADWKLGELLIHKVDAFQGGERLLVVLDLTISTGVEFL